MLRWIRARRSSSRTDRGVALVTASFGGIDPIRALPVHDGIDAFYYTDAKTAGSADPAVTATWSRVIVPNYPRDDFAPRLRAKYFKVQIHRLDEVRSHRWLVWADGSLRFKGIGFLVEAAARLARLPPHHRVLLVPHPERATISQEFQFVQEGIQANDTYLQVRYAQERLPEQMEYFRSRGWSLEAKLWCGGIWMIENNEIIRRAWDAWWDQNLRFGLMDQLSLPVVLEDHGIEPQALDIHLWDNPYFTWIQHVREM